MKNFPYMTEYVNDVFEREKLRWDYILLRPVLLIFYFLFRLIVFPLKYLVHRRPYGFESYCIDSVLAFGIKYFASTEAIELIVRHAQIEPLLYRFLLGRTTDKLRETHRNEIEKGLFQGIDGDFTLDSLSDVIRNRMTLAHDDLSYEVVERFNAADFLNDLNRMRTTRPEEHQQFGKAVIEENRRHSLQLFGCTNVVIFIVMTITLFGDLRSLIRALNSFGSDSLLLWCLKHIYVDNPSVLINLDFYLQPNNRNHYNNSPFFSDPSLYLFSHIAFDEYAYELLMSNPAPSQVPQSPPISH